MRLRKYLPIMLVLLLYSSVALADRCIIPILPIKVREEMQVAIIGWNGETEVMILSTVVSPAIITQKPDIFKKVELVEVLPLKTIPSVEAASIKAFYVFEKLMMKSYYPFGTFTLRGGVEVIYSKRIGPHTITLLEADSGEDLYDWIVNYCRSRSIDPPKVANVSEYISVLNDYIDDGYQYFAIDVVEIGVFSTYIMPLKYKFASDCIYYPLRVSKTLSGETQIRLFIVTKDRIPPEQIESLGFKILNEKLISIDKIAEADKDLANLFKGYNKVWATLIYYEGPADKLDRDLILRPGFSLRFIMPYILLFSPTLAVVLPILALEIYFRRKGA